MPREMVLEDATDEEVRSLAQDLARTRDELAEHRKTKKEWIGEWKAQEKTLVEELDRLITWVNLRKAQHEVETTEELVGQVVQVKRADNGRIIRSRAAEVADVQMDAMSVIDEARKSARRGREG